MATEDLSAKTRKSLTWGVALGGYEDDAALVENGDSSLPSIGASDTVADDSISESISNHIGGALEPHPGFDEKKNRILR